MIIEVLKALLVLKSTIMKLWSLVSWNGTSFIDGSGNFITLDSRVADWTALQAIPKVAVNDGVEMYVLSLRAWFIYNHALGRWQTTDQVIYSQTFGTKSAPTCSIAAGTTAAQVFPHGTINLPRYLLDAGSCFRITAWFQRHGVGSAPVISMYLGTTNSVSTDPTVWAATFTAMDGHTLNAAPLITMMSKTNLLSSYANPDNQGASTNNGDLEKTSNIDADATNGMYVNLGIAAKNTADSYDMLFLMIELKRV